MKKLVLASLFALSTTVVFAADTWTMDKGHSETSFQVRHIVTNVRGKFSDFSGTVVADLAKPAASSVEFTIKTASIDTSNADRDKHLRSANFFDTDKYPDITFKSTSVKATSKKNVYSVTGNLTMHGVTKQVTLPVTFLGAAKDPWGNDRAGFETHTTLKRKDFGINWNKALDNGGVLLGEDVDVSINLETIKKK